MGKMSLFKRFKMLTLWNKLGAIGSLASIVGLLLFFAPSGKNDSTTELYVKSARFNPVATFFVEQHDGFHNDLYETAFLYLTVLNIGSTDVYITSVEVVDENNRGLLSRAYSSAGLSADISKNTPVKISAGKEVELSYAGGFKFNGLVDAFDLIELSKEYYFPEASPNISARNSLVHELNQKLSAILKGESKITVKLYTGNRNLILEHVFNITNGTGIFDDTGKIQHPYFLGELIHWLNSEYSKNTLNKLLKSDG